MHRIDLSEDLSFSRLIYGMWRLADDANTGADHVRAKMDACLEQGITTFDQADIYGGFQSEEVMGGALKADRSLRDKIEIVTKCGILFPADKYPDVRVKHYDTSRAHIMRSVDNSLKAMSTDYIDMLLIHRPDPFMDFNETGAALDEVVQSGKVRAVGVSNFKISDWSALQMTMDTKLMANQIEISLLESSSFRNGHLVDIAADNMLPMAWSPLAGGSLFADNYKSLFDKLTAIGKQYEVDASAVAIAWILAHPSNILPVLGTNNLERIRSLGDAMKIEMDRQTWYELYEDANGHEVP